MPNLTFYFNFIIVSIIYFVILMGIKLKLIFSLDTRKNRLGKDTNYKFNLFWVHMSQLKKKL